MLHPTAVVWQATALGVAAALLLLGLAWLLSAWGGADESDEDSGSDGGGGGSRRPPPRRPLPTGPVCWPEFERQFAAYVERRSERRMNVSADAAPDGGSAAPASDGNGP